MSLIENEALRREMSRRAREHAQRYTPQRMANTYLSAYRYLAGKGEVAATNIASASPSAFVAPDYLFRV